MNREVGGVISIYRTLPYDTTRFWVDGDGYTCPGLADPNLLGLSC